MPLSATSPLDSGAYKSRNDTSVIFCTHTAAEGILQKRYVSNLEKVLELHF